jgi:hypothetical protein
MKRVAISETIIYRCLRPGELATFETIKSNDLPCRNFQRHHDKLVENQSSE